MARIALIAGKSDVAPEHQHVVDRIVRTFGGVVGPSSILLHTPKMAVPIYDLGDYFRNESVVPARLRLLGIMVAARERQGAFVWGAQLDAARRAGVAEATIELLRSRADPARFAAEEGEVGADHRLGAGPVPLLTGVHLVVPSVLAGLGMKRDDRADEQVVALVGRAVVARMRRGVAGADVD